MSVRTASLREAQFHPADVSWLFQRGGRGYAPMAAPYGVSLHDETGPLCCFGIASPWPGLGIAWMEEVSSEALAPHRYQVASTVLRHFRRWTQETPYRRIEAHAPCAHALANRLLRKLGFVLVTRKLAYGRGGESVNEYCWLPKE